MTGKGDMQRPCQVSRRAYADNWDAVFGVARLGETVDIGRLSEVMQRAILGFALSDLDPPYRPTPDGTGHGECL